MQKHVLARADLSRPGPERLATIQAARAVAAVLVVLFHNSVAIFDMPKYWGYKPFGGLFDFGDSGVNFFFVLSGFIILTAHRRDIGQPGRLRAFVSKRWRRIYPIYWVALLLVLPVNMLMPRLEFGWEAQPAVILQSFLLLHVTTLHTTIIVSWTLFHELLFYVLFGLLIWRPRVGQVAFLAWFASCLAAMAIVTPGTLPGFYLSHLNLLFLFGLAAAWWCERRTVRWPVSTLLLGTAVFLLAGVDEVVLRRLDDAPRALVFGLGAALVVVGLVASERRGWLRVPAWLRLIGDASYSIYLVHFMVLSIAAKLAWTSGLALLVPGMLAYVLLAALAIATGVVFHIVVERRLLAALGRRFGSKPILLAT